MGTVYGCLWLIMGVSLPAHVIRTSAAFPERAFSFLPLPSPYVISEIWVPSSVEKWSACTTCYVTIQWIDLIIELWSLLRYSVLHSHIVSDCEPGHPEFEASPCIMLRQLISNDCWEVFKNLNAKCRQLYNLFFLNMHLDKSAVSKL